MTDDELFEAFVSDEYILEEMEVEAGRAGFSMEVLDREFRFDPSSSDTYSDYLPTIYARVDLDQIYNDKAYLTVKMELPSEIDGDDLSYEDSFEYIADQYMEAAKFCTWLQKNGVSLSMEEE